MSFKDYYLKEMSYVSLDGIDCPKNVVNNYQDLSEVPYSVNPSKSDYIQLLKSPLSTFKWDGEVYAGVRIGITKDNKVYMFPTNIMHIAIMEALNINFVYRLQYDIKNYFDTYLTDTPTDFTMYYKKDYKQNMKDLVNLLTTKLDYIPAKFIKEWYHGKDSKSLVDFNKYIDIRNVKNGEMKLKIEIIINVKCVVLQKN